MLFSSGYRVVWWVISIGFCLGMNSNWLKECSNVKDLTAPRFVANFNGHVDQLRGKFGEDLFADVHYTNASYTDVFLSCLELRSMTEEARESVTIMESAKPLREKLSERSEISGSMPPDGYSNLAQVHAFLEKIVADHPDIAALYDLSDYGAGRTFEGRPLPMIKISDNPQRSEDEHRILILGAHHAREIVTPHLVMDIANRLTSNYHNNSLLKSVIDNYEIFLAPVWNPDGYNYVWTNNNMWRKNRKLNQGGSYGVDQNRNYDMGWDSSCGGSTNPTSNTYRGLTVNSEEETSTNVDFTISNNLAKVLDFHSSGREVLIGFACNPLARMVDNLQTSEGTALASLANYRLRKPSADGEHQEASIMTTTSYAFLVETQTTFQPPFSGAVQEAERLWPLVQGFLNRPISLYGKVTGDVVGSGVEAEITIPGVTGVRRWSNPGQGGLYHYFLPVGTHQVTFTNEFFNPVTITVTITSLTTSLERDIRLYQKN